MHWHGAEGNPPPPGGDCRKLVWLVDRDGMGWVGIRAYHHGKGQWWINAVNGGREESAAVTHWMDLPQPPPEGLPPNPCERPWYCKARHAGTAGGNEPQDCDWPFCGCDPAANRVLHALEEAGLLRPRSATIDFDSPPPEDSA